MNLKQRLKNRVSELYGTKFTSIERINQCGDYFLLHFCCPWCNSEHFSSAEAYKNIYCECKKSFTDLVLEADRFQFILVTGTKRKARFPVKMIRQMYALQDEKCAYCLTFLDNIYHVEHIVPLCVGGTNRYSNICLSCPRCNLLAGTAVFGNFGEKQDFILGKVKALRSFSTRG